MRLPLEVKNVIYKYTFGDNLIHIIQNPDEGAAKFKNTICRALITEEEAQENFEREDTHQWYAPANEGRHDCCRYQKGAAFRDGKQRPEVLGLGLLRCCRQIYNEAHHVPYSTNTFSFADPETLQSFSIWLAQGSDGNHLATRSLFLEMEYGGYHPGKSWDKAVAACAKQLKSLQHVSISIELPFYFVKVYGHGYNRPGSSLKNIIIPAIHALKKLSLKTVAVVVSDQKAEDHFSRMASLEANHRCTLDEKKEMARYVKEVLKSIQ